MQHFRTFELVLALSEAALALDTGLLEFKGIVSRVLMYCQLGRDHLNKYDQACLDAMVSVFECEFRYAEYECERKIKSRSLNLVLFEQSRVRSADRVICFWFSGS